MIPFLDFGGSGPPLHFAHANGYPPACYRPLLEQLSAHYHVLAMNQRPLWPGEEPEKLSDWHPLSGDLLHFLEEQKLDPVIAIGHSLGGIVSLRAALHRPERFRALILIDPVFFPPRMIHFMRLIRALKMDERIHPLVPGALNRRRTFKNLEELFVGYRRKTIFRYMDDNNLRACIEGITQPRPEGGFELAYKPEWEVRIYLTGVWNDMDLWRGLSRLRIPSLLIRGAETNTFWASTARHVHRKLPSARLVNIPDASHLVPLEQPGAVYQAIKTFLKET